MVDEPTAVKANGGSTPRPSLLRSAAAAPAAVQDAVDWLSGSSQGLSTHSLEAACLPRDGV